MEHDMAEMEQEEQEEQEAPAVVPAGRRRATGVDQYSMTVVPRRVVVAAANRLGYEACFSAPRVPAPGASWARSSVRILLAAPAPFVEVVSNGRLLRFATEGGGRWATVSVSRAALPVFSMHILSLQAVTQVVLSVSGSTLVPSRAQPCPGTVITSGTPRPAGAVTGTVFWNTAPPSSSSTSHMPPVLVMRFVSPLVLFLVCLVVLLAVRCCCGPRRRGDTALRHAPPSHAPTVDHAHAVFSVPPPPAHHSVPLYGVPPHGQHGYAPLPVQLAVYPNKY